MFSFRGDSQENEEIRQQLEALRSTLDTTSKELSESIQSVLGVVNSLENSESALTESVKSISQQVAQLNGFFMETAKNPEENFIILHERDKKLEGDGASRLDAIDGALKLQEDRANSHAGEVLGKLLAQTQRLDSLENSLTAKLAHLDDWKSTLPPDESNDEAAWIDEINSELRRLAKGEELRGNARLFAMQLGKNLSALRQLSNDIETHDAAHFATDATVQHFDRVLFRPHFGVEWIDIGEDEYGRAGLKSRARAELRALETAILNYRRRLQEKLKARHNFQPIYIVPQQTLFDPALHETTEMYSMPTNERAKDNRIISIERNGYQLDGKVLCRSFVRRFLWDESAEPTPVEESEITEDASEIEEAPATDAAEGVLPTQGFGNVSLPVTTEEDLSEEEKERRAAAAMNK